MEGKGRACSGGFFPGLLAPCKTCWYFVLGALGIAVGKMLVSFSTARPSHVKVPQGLITKVYHTCVPLGHLDLYFQAGGILSAVEDGNRRGTLSAHVMNTGEC